MPDQRRFDEAAITEIFRQAAEAQSEAQNKASSAHGLTLAELQEVGKEAGLSPEFVAQAAMRLIQPEEAAQPPTFMGLTVGVGHEVELPRPMDDQEWERLVSDLRGTFQARGKIREYGGLREWSNGNLHALIEPTDTGHRLRMGTLKGSAREFIAAGIGLVLMSLFGAVVLSVAGSDVTLRSLMGLTMVAAAGVGLAGNSIFRLRPWARTRERQMIDIGERTLARMGNATTTEARPVENEGFLELDETMAADEAVRQTNRVRES